MKEEAPPRDSPTTMSFWIKTSWQQLPTIKTRGVEIWWVLREADTMVARVGFGGHECRGRAKRMRGFGGESKTQQGKKSTYFKETGAYSAVAVKGRNGQNLG